MGSEKEIYKEIKYIEINTSKANFSTGDFSITLDIDYDKNNKKWKAIYNNYVNYICKKKVKII